MPDRLIITNCVIYQGRGRRLIGQSILIDGSVIKQIAPISELQATYGAARKIDLEGGMVIPGLVDSHLHLAQLAIYLQSVDCELPSKTNVLEQVRQKAAASSSQWLLGYGWNQNLWEPPVFGTAADLDSVSEGKAIVLFAKSLHALWANTKAMQLAGISQASSAPASGAILRSANGNPSGIFLENAMGLIEKAIPELPPDQLTEYIYQAQNHLISMGITGVHDFDRFESYAALKSLEEAGRLHLRVAKSLPAEELKKILEIDYRQLLSTKHLRPGWIKNFADGALGPHSASMFEPYEGSKDRGMLLLRRKEIFELGMQSIKHHWPL